MPFVKCPSLPKTCQTILVFYTTNNVNHNFAKYVKIHVAQIFVQQYFFPTFFCPRSWLDLPTPGGIHYGFAWRCFPLLGLELKFFGVDVDQIIFVAGSIINYRIKVLVRNIFLEN